MSLVEQEYRAGLVDVERGGADRADVLSRLEAGVVRAIAPGRRRDPISSAMRAEVRSAEIHVYRVSSAPAIGRRGFASRRT